jgi:tripartite-type tricarboxylate transporter receptor subunit TctC
MNAMRRALLMALLLCASALAQEFPAKAVRVVVSFPAGGPNDLTARPVAQKLTELTGQPFVMDYRPGANGIIGTEAVARAPADGYTMLIISSSYTINPSTYAKLPFDTLRDMVGIGPIARGHIVFVVNPIVPARTVKEFVAIAKARHGKLTFGSSGLGGSLHLGAELLMLVTGVNMVHIPYKGAALSLTEVIGGHIDCMFIAAPGAIPQMKAGKIRVLAVASPRRAAAMPDVPTFAEQGLASVEIDSGYGFVTAAATPAPTVARMNALINKAVATGDVRERFSAMGIEPYTSSREEYAVFLRESVEKWRRVVTAAKLTPQ